MIVAMIVLSSSANLSKKVRKSVSLQDQNECLTGCNNILDNCYMRCTTKDCAGKFVDLIMKVVKQDAEVNSMLFNRNKKKLFYNLKNSFLITLYFNF